MGRGSLHRRYQQPRGGEGHAGWDALDFRRDGQQRSADAGTGDEQPAFLSAGVGVDGSGNVYIADTNNHVVEKVTPAGTLSIFAGTGSSGAPAPGPATSSALAPGGGGGRWVGGGLHRRHPQRRGGEGRAGRDALCFRRDGQQRSAGARTGDQQPARPPGGGGGRWVGERLHRRPPQRRGGEGRAGRDALCFRRDGKQRSACAWTGDEQPTRLSAWGGGRWVGERLHRRQR